MGVSKTGVIMVLIAWQLDLQLPMQSLPITTKVVSSNPTQGSIKIPETVSGQ
jgi:hypothetical protein